MLNIRKVKRKKRTFWDDPFIGERLDDLPDDEMSVTIRMALRNWFGLPNTKGGMDNGKTTECSRRDSGPA